MKTCNSLLFTQILLLSTLWHQSIGFVHYHPRSISRRIRHFPNLLSEKNLINTQQNNNGNNNTLVDNTPIQQITILAFDGTVANTSSWRSNLAIDVAYSTWPKELSTGEMGVYQFDDPSTDRTWIVNKLNALMQHLLSDQNGMDNVDAVLLTRLLMEEQLLDRGRSTGKTGKYASKFHPRQNLELLQDNDDSDDYDDDGDDCDDKITQISNTINNQGSRPLTVGEITANWVNGASLRDTVRVKYNVDRKDPIPIIKQKMEERIEMGGLSEWKLPYIQPRIANYLQNSLKVSTVFIMVGSAHHLETAKQSLEKVSIVSDTITLDDIGPLLREGYDKENDLGVILVAPGGGNRGHVGILQNIIMSSSDSMLSSIHFIHPIVKTLQESKVLFGDNRYDCMN